MMETFPERHISVEYLHVNVTNVVFSFYYISFVFLLLMRQTHVCKIVCVLFTWIEIRQIPKYQRKHFCSYN